MTFPSRHFRRLCTVANVFCGQFANYTTKAMTSDPSFSPTKGLKERKQSTRVNKGGDKGERWRWGGGGRGVSLTAAEK